MENEQSYDVRNRDNTIIAYHSELQRRKHSNSRADTAESMDRKKSKKKLQGRNHGHFFGEAKPMGGYNLPPLSGIGLMYLKI